MKSVVKQQTPSAGETREYPERFLAFDFHDEEIMFCVIFNFMFNSDV